MKEKKQKSHLLCSQSRAKRRKKATECFDIGSLLWSEGMFCIEKSNSVKGVLSGYLYSRGSALVRAGNDLTCHGNDIMVQLNKEKTCKK